MSSPGDLTDWVRCYTPSFHVPAEALLAGRDRGLHTAVLQPPHDGVPVYQQMDRHRGRVPPDEPAASQGA
ncbi:MAG: hypothetical protein ABJB47_20270 [Actinomycetota bacterium]